MQRAVMYRYVLHLGKRVVARSAWRVRSTKLRDTAERDVDRAARSTSKPTGSCVRR